MKEQQIFAIDNYDPIGGANVLSRGIYRRCAKSSGRRFTVCTKTIHLPERALYRETRFTACVCGRWHRRRQRASAQPAAHDSAALRPALVRNGLSPHDYLVANAASRCHTG